jgi:hypothetical protein
MRLSTAISSVLTLGACAAAANSSLPIVDLGYGLWQATLNVRTKMGKSMI